MRGKSDAMGGWLLGLKNDLKNDMTANLMDSLVSPALA